MPEHATSPWSRPSSASLVAVVHSSAFLAWVAAAGVSRSAESILFGVIVACSVLRAKALWLELRPARSSVPLKCYTTLMIWMSLAALWRPDSVPASESLPGRWFLIPFLIAPSQISQRGVLVAMAIPGAFWALIGVVAHLNVAPSSSLLPKHPSHAFLGLMLLAAAGLGTFSASRSPRTAIIGASMIAVSMAGVSVFSSRTLAIAILAALLVASAILISHRRTTLGIATTALIGVFAWSIPSTPVGAKFFDYWDAGGSEQSDTLLGTSLETLYKANSSGRWRFHAWTLENIQDAWLLGHGGGSWAYQWEAAASDAHPDPAVPYPTGSIGPCTPTYRWKPVPRAESYLLWVRDSTGSTQEQWVPSESIVATGTHCEFTSRTPLPPGRSSWRVRARDQMGQLLPWSEEWTFVVSSLEAPTPLSSTIHDATGQPEYRWSPVPVATWYQLWTRDASGTVSRQWYRVEEVQLGAECSVRPDESVRDGIVTWWVRAWSKESGNGPWSVGSQVKSGNPVSPAWHAHQMYLQAVYEYGCIGLGLLLLLLTSLAIASWRRRDAAGAAALFLLVIVSITGLTDLAIQSFGFAVVSAAMISLTSLASAPSREAKSAISYR